MQAWQLVRPHKDGGANVFQQQHLLSHRPCMLTCLSPVSQMVSSINAGLCRIVDVMDSLLSMSTWRTVVRELAKQ